MAVPPALIPEGGLTFGIVMVALMVLFLLALNRAWQLTLGTALLGLAALFDALGFTIPVVNHRVSLSFIGDWFRSANNAVLNLIGVGIEANKDALHSLIGWFTWVFQATADEVANLATDVAGAFETHRHVLIPRMIRAATHSIWLRLSHLERSVADLANHPATIITKTRDVIAPGIDRLEGRVGKLEHELQGIEAEVKALPHSAATIIERVQPRALPRIRALPHEVPQIIERVEPGAIPHEITDGIDGLWKRVKRFGRTLTPAGIVGLVAAATGALGLTHARCENSQRWGKNICGMNPDLLESLIADTALILGTVDLVEFARELGTVVGYAQKETARFWRT